MKVVIGYNGSESGDAIFEDLKRAGLPRDSQALVVSVGDLMMSSPPITEALALGWRGESSGEIQRNACLLDARLGDQRIKLHRPENVSF